MMKHTLEEAAHSFAESRSSGSMFPAYYMGFIAGAEWQKEQDIEVLSSVLENWVHGGDADCIIAEFEEKIKMRYNETDSRSSKARAYIKLCNSN